MSLLHIDPAHLRLPDRHQEAWKYTDLNRYFGTRPLQLEAAGDQLPPDAELQALLACSLAPTDGYRLVFVDGQFQPSLSNAPLNPQAATAALDGSGPKDLQDLLALSKLRHWQLSIKTSLEQPLYLLFLYRKETPRHSNTRLDIRLAPETEADLVEEHVGGAAGLALLDLNLHLAARARLTHTRLQHCDADFTLLQRQIADLQDAAQLRQVHVEWGARLSRLDARIDLAGTAARLDTFALSGLSDQQHVDHQVLVRHLQPRAISRLRARGIVDDRARQVFNGKIYVERGAQGTDSDQLLRNLLLSDRAEVDAKPELEIYADDVRCAHGSTVGRLDDTALFYLRSRGIDQATARRLLMLSFAEWILQEMPQESLRSATREAFADHLHLRLSA